jgi:hypothetical protein
MPPRYTAGESRAVTTSRYWAAQHTNEPSFDNMARFTVWVDEFNGISNQLRLHFINRLDMMYKLEVQISRTAIFFTVQIIKGPSGGYDLLVGNQAVRDLGSLIHKFTSWATMYRIRPSQKMVYPSGRKMKEMALLQESMSALHLRLDALEQDLSGD